MYYLRDGLKERGLPKLGLFLAYSFAIMKLSFGGEMYGTWLVDGQLADSQSADFRGALSKAKNFKASIGSENLMLPVTKDVKTWAAACGK